jgi:hypothetical protein
VVSLMGPGTGQKLRPLESKDVSFSVSWWLEQSTTVWELLLITRDLRLKCILRLFDITAMQSLALNKRQRSKFHRDGVSHQPAPSIDKQKKRRNIHFKRRSRVRVIPFTI